MATSVINNDLKFNLKYQNESEEVKYTDNGIMCVHHVWMLIIF